MRSRATASVTLQSLDKDHSIELVRKRIEQVGGSSIEPFTQSALLRIYEATDGFPREILRVCHDCTVTAAEADKSIIDEDDVDDVLDEGADDMNSEGGASGTETDADGTGGETTESGDIDRLTPKQRAVYDAIVDLEEATSGDIVDRIGAEDYESRSHAIRSVNNILRRLMEQDAVDRDRRGRTYIYRPAE
ncbi:MAG: BlaI/MecI/CopY family transcriptional regulator [Candidatus Nanohaloarchaea archaeon]